MLFKEQKRKQEKIKIKPGILELAKEIASYLDPYDEEPCIDKLFERLVTNATNEAIQQGYSFKSLNQDIIELPPSEIQAIQVQDFTLGDDIDIEDEAEDIAPIEQLLAQEN